MVNKAVEHRGLISTIPNILTVSRLFAAPLIIIVYFIEGSLSYWLAVFIFVIASITDFLDGYIARSTSSLSNFGAMMDPIADKLLVAAAFVFLLAKDILVDYSIIPVIIILSREILISGIREFLGQLQVSVPVSQLAKIKTGFQMVAIAVLLSGKYGDLLIPYASEIGLTLLWMAAIITVYTGYEYYLAGQAYFLDNDK